LGRHLAVLWMFPVAGRLGFALVLAVLCLGGRTAHAQAAAVPYWSPGWPIGFGGIPTVDQDSNTYGNFDGSGAGGTRTNFPNGMFVAGTSSAGLGWNGINQLGAFGHFGSLRYEGMQAGYNFGSAGGLPVTVYAGFDTLKYDSGIGGPFAPFDTKSGTLPGYRAHAGVEFQATPNVSLSFGVGYTQQSGNIDSEINSLPGASSIIPSGRR
jgi:opacity protein-like surface antigen